MPTYFCPWTLNLHIAIVLLHLRVHYSVEIKHYKVKLELEFIEALKKQVHNYKHFRSTFSLFHLYL